MKDSIKEVSSSLQTTNKKTFRPLKEKVQELEEQAKNVANQQDPMLKDLKFTKTKVDQSEDCLKEKQEKDKKIYENISKLEKNVSELENELRVLRSEIKNFEQLKQDYEMALDGKKNAEADWKAKQSKEKQKSYGKSLNQRTMTGKQKQSLFLRMSLLWNSIESIGRIIKKKLISMRN